MESQLGVSKEKKELGEKLQSFGQLVEAKFTTAVMDYLEEGPRRPGYHTTNTTQKCLRNGYLTAKETKTNNQMRRATEKSSLTFAIGKKLHEIPFGDYHEYEILHYHGLDFSGTADEIFIDFRTKEVLIVDKKTKVFLPK